MDSIHRARSRSPWVGGRPGAVLFRGAAPWARFGLILLIGALGCAPSAEHGTTRVPGAPDSAVDAAAPEPRTPEELVTDLEGLAFVPGGRTSIGSPLDVGSAADLLVGRYEVRHVEWRRTFAGRNPVPAVFGPGGAKRDVRPRPEAWTQDVPAVGMTLAEARAFAAEHGQRLLTVEEWLWCAVGPRSRLVPSGRRQRGFANTRDEGLLRAMPVGTFESGKTPDGGLYDLLGNVWEWIEPPPPSMRGWGVENEAAWPDGTASRAPAWVMGGSFTTKEGPIFTRSRQLMAKAVMGNHRSTEIGLRCCAGATRFLRELPQEMPAEAAMRARVRGVGARWGVRAVDSIDAALRARPGNPWLLALRSGASQSHR